MIWLRYHVTPILYKIDGNHFNILSGDFPTYGPVINVRNFVIIGLCVILSVNQTLLKMKVVLKNTLKQLLEKSLHKLL